MTTFRGTNNAVTSKSRRFNFKQLQLIGTYQLHNIKKLSGNINTDTLEYAI